MRIFGADLGRERSGSAESSNAIVALDAAGRVAEAAHPSSLAEVAAQASSWAEGEPFLLAVNVPLVVPEKVARTRPVENLVRRRLGLKLPPGGRLAGGAQLPGLTGEALMAALAAAGHPCLPYPDRNRRSSGLAEIHPGLVVKALLWESSPAARLAGQPDRDELVQAYAAEDYRDVGRGRNRWAERVMTLDLLVRGLSGTEGLDLRLVREGLATCTGPEEIERTAAVFDATLLAATARRYVTAPEDCIFLGDLEQGYTILPADGLIRRMALQDGPPQRGQLFPRASLRERLGNAAELKPLDLLNVPGKPERLEAIFKRTPRYEFDNLDEMLWWKHCRHVEGPTLPVEGLQEMQVRLTGEEEARNLLRLVRSRHRTLSFRFDPPGTWRNHLPTRDGRTYGFLVVRATYEALPAG